MVGVAPTEDEFRENKVRWFRQIQLRPVGAAILVQEDYSMEIIGEGRPKCT